MNSEDENDFADLVSGLNDTQNEIIDTYHKIGNPIVEEILAGKNAVHKVHIRLKYMTALLALYRTMTLSAPPEAIREVENYVDMMMDAAQRAQTKTKQMA